MPRRLHQKRFLLLHSLLLLHASIRHTSHLRLLSLPPVLLWRIRRISPPNLSTLPLVLHLDQTVIARAYRWTNLGWGRSSEQTAANGMWSRVPSESSAAGTSAAEEKKAP
ncbi:hypothetical protein EV363DRAFT_1344110, partial [Boletus edulis]